MIIDVTGVVLTPGNHGVDCLGNGAHFDADGAAVECCCDECDYWMCCMNIAVAMVVQMRIAPAPKDRRGGPLRPLAKKQHERQCLSCSFR